MDHQTPIWKSISNNEELYQAIEDSRTKPVLFFKHSPSSSESIDKKLELDEQWDIEPGLVDLYMMDDRKDVAISQEISEIAGIPNEFPQIVLFADSVTMYDESSDMISVKKIKLALKIVNRTFKWMETRA